MIYLDILFLVNKILVFLLLLDLLRSSNSTILFFFYSSRLRMGRHSGIGVEKYFRTQGRPSDGALYLVRKCILGDTTSAAVVTPWQPTYTKKSILNEVTRLQTGLSSSRNRYYFRSPPRATSDFVIFLADRNSDIGVWPKNDSCDVKNNRFSIAGSEFSSVAKLSIILNSMESRFLTISLFVKKF